VESDTKVRKGHFTLKHFIMNWSNLAYLHHQGHDMQ
jgi:hypothetical protein